MNSVRQIALGITVIAALFLWRSEARAYVDPPLLVPPIAAVNETVGVQLGSGYCDAFVEDPNNEYPQITRTGNHVRLVMFSVHYDDLAQCIFAPETFVAPLGGFGLGQYVVQVDRVYPNFGGGLTTEALGEFALTVGGGAAAPAQLPANSVFALGLLLLALVIFSARAFKRFIAP